jgi:hypothetical protein
MSHDTEVVITGKPAGQVHYITVSNVSYNLLKGELMKLQPKKRKNFKTTLADSNGVKSKVIYRDEKFYNYNSHIKHWCEVKTYEEVFEMCDFQQGKATTKLGKIMKQCVELKNKDDSIDTDEIMTDCLLIQQNLNHTGNHYRNHCITVPSSVYGNKSGIK